MRYAIKTDREQLIAACKRVAEIDDELTKALQTVQTLAQENQRELQERVCKLREEQRLCREKIRDLDARLENLRAEFFGLVGDKGRKGRKAMKLALEIVRLEQKGVLTQKQSTYRDKLTECFRKLLPPDEGAPTTLSIAGSIA